MKTKLIVLLFAIAISAFAEENVGSKRKAAKIKSIAAGCAAPSAKEELDINNVRTTILDAGDLWWNAMAQQGPQYEIPKDGKKHSIFAGSLWVGGIDASGNLRMAAQTYRQTGIDFWPGPVDIASASTDPGTCLTYDKLWKITYQQIKDFKDFTESNPPTGYTASSIPDVIKTWPGNVSGNPAQTLAPFIDVDGNGIYDYSAGDYPDNIQLHPNSGQFYCDDCTSHPDILFGDQSIWWVFNDVGNIHTETGGATIGIEVHAQAFGFATNDEINNMTFYKYKIINRSSAQLNQNYFGVFVDADLGYAYDDYVGCDVPRGLGYCYNGDDDDQGPSGYGFNPPAVGMDFFQGPKADPTDTSYTDRNCGLDPHRTCKQLIMSRFIYFNNQNSPPNGNPFTATEYYGYLKGIWKNGVPMTYGGDGIGGGNGATNIPAKYMFPGNTDHQYEWGTGGSCNSPATAQLDWNEVSAGTVPDDRRFLQSAGPFTLKPGAVNYVTTGVVWARATQGGPLASVNLLRITDDKAQALFNNCFQILNGPDAPDVSIRELDKEIILSLSNALSSNNYKEQYFEIDPFILNDSNNLYRFQGYQIFQIINQSVATTDLHNTDKARLIAEVDIKDGVAQIVNHYPDNTNSTFLSVTEAEGSDKGIRHSFRVLTDAFASGATRLINHKNYFYMVIAYGFNAVEVTADPYDANHDGHAQPFIAGRRNVKVYTAIPHIPSPENYGQVLNSIYGAGPKITRVEGTGNGFVIDYDSRLALDLTPETVNQILSSSSGYWARHPEYENGRGPVNIKVYDPVRVQKGQFKLWLDSKDSTSYWNLEKLPDGDTIRSTTNIVSPNEQLFPEYGLSINVTQVLNPLSQIGNNVPGFVEATKTYEDPTKSWLSGVPDADGIPALDWIISAATTGNVDPTKTYDKILGGTWAPYRVCAITAHAPGTNKPNALSQPSNNFYQNLPSIDLVLTRDISKWSKCVVVEANADSALAFGVLKGGIKRRLSLDI
ncbi:MAG: hypothetical protein JJE25_11470, partial [Bacteroidia bacterium]|nr:hypothetical protein [Bacteroidia bacterium]